MRPRLLAVALVALASAGCGGSDPAGDPTTTTGDETAPSVPSDGTVAVSGTSSTAPAPPEPAGGGAPADGRHAGYLKGVDEGRRTVVVDVVQFFTGEAAVEAAAADGRGEVDNDYYIRNANPRLRTLPLADAVEVTLLDIEMGGTDAARSVPADIAALARVVAHDVQAGSTEANPYWLTVAGGRVTKVEQQYLP